MDDFGGKLRQARERRGISLRQIAASTKISAAALEALERNDVSKLPGGIFSRAFVRSYATEVGLDPDQTVKEFLDCFHGEPPPTATMVAAIPEEESNFESQQRMAGVLLKLVLISLPIAGVILYVTLRSRPSLQGGGTPLTEQATPAAPSHEPPAASPLVVPAPAGASQPPVVPAVGMNMTLELHPTGACWVNLTVDGENVLSRVMQAGEKETRQVRQSAIIDVGDAGAFAFSIDGRPGRSLGDVGQVRTARITRETLASYLK